MEKYNLGLVSISFRNHSPKEILEKMKEANLSCIEWGSDVHAPYNDMEKLNEIVSFQKEYGISCSSYGTYFRLGETPIEELYGYIKAAKILGTNILRLWCGTKSGKDMTDEEKNFLISECKKTAEIAKENDVVFCMECHQNTFTENLDDICFLMQTVNSPNFRMYWQPFQNLEFEENLFIAKNVAPYNEHIHVFNWKGKERFPLSHAKNVWQSFLKEFPYPKTLLLEFMPDGKLSTLKQEAKALFDIIGGLI